MFQFHVRRVVAVVDRCGEMEAVIELEDPDHLSFGRFSDVQPRQPCDPQDMDISARLHGVLHGVGRYAGGRPGDRLTLSGENGEIILAQPAANPTGCADC